MTRRDWIALGLILLVAAGVRVSALDSPPRRVFDEIWYARDACFYWLEDQRRCELSTFRAPDRDVQQNLREHREVTPEHPPLGKWLIGGPIRVFGFGPRAWRLASVGAGVLTVALLFLFARLAFRSTGIAAGSSLLLAVDYPHFIHSRMALLDIFLGLFTFAAFLFCFLDHRQIAARIRGAPAHQGWRLAAGVAAGAAAATKPSGGTVAAGVLLLIAGWELVERRRATGSFRGFGRAAGWIALLLVVVPLAVHAATYAGRLDATVLAVPWEEGSWPREWVDRQSYIMSLHVDKPSTLGSRWALPMTSPAQAYLLERQGDSVREILLFGNPLLWWAGFAALVFVAVRWLRDRRGAIEPVIVVGFLAAYASWLAATLTKTVAFLFYVVPVAPFVYLALAYVYAQLPRTRAVTVVGTAVVALSVAAFLFFLPILSARPLGVDAWRARACPAQALWLDQKPECGLREATAPRG